MSKTTPMTPMSRHCFIAFLALVLCLPLWLAKPSHAIEVVPQTADFYVNDAADLLSPGTKQYIIDINRKLKKACGAQVVVVTVPDLGGAALEDYATTLFRQYGIGDKEKNNGLLLLLARKERKSRIEVGYGLEGVLNDAKTGRIQDEYMIPRFKESMWNVGMKNGFNALVREIQKEYGISVVDDFSKIRELAEQGDATAQYKLGIMYLEGDGVALDRQKAAEWIQKAAAQGLDAAQYYLGLLHQWGTGVAHDKQKAAEWYQKAAEQGHGKAQAALGFLYEQGDGVQQDKAIAREWYGKACNNGVKRGCKAYDKLNVAGSKSTETPAKTATAKADTAKTDTAKATTAKTDTAKADTAKADSGLEETKGKPLSDSPLIIAGMIFVVVWSVVMTAVSFRSRDQWFIKGCRWWYAGSVIVCVLSWLEFGIDDGLILGAWVMGTLAILVLFIIMFHLAIMASGIVPAYHSLRAAWKYGIYTGTFRAWGKGRGRRSRGGGGSSGGGGGSGGGGSSRGF